MERIKYHEPPHSKKERIGIPTGILNRDNQEILTGDFIKLKSSGYDGVFLWNRHQGCYGIYFGLWYLDRDPYNPDCYGKFIDVPADQGMRMELIPITKEELTYDKW